MDNLEKIVDESFYTYAGMVIADRAIVDVRDCLKPSPRVLLYNQYQRKNYSNKPFVKSAAVVGDALKTFYYHGDQSCYQMYSRMAAPYSMRYLLNNFHGNYGTLSEGVHPAAMRYTEMRLSEISTDYLFAGLNKNAIEVWRDNFDETDKSPSCLPSVGYYNICNGSIGLGIGVSSSIPQFNLKEVNQAIIKLMRNPQVAFEEIYCPPDFATGGIITNAAEVMESLRVGQGKSCRIRSVIEYDAKKHELLVKQLPYSVFSSTIKEQIKKLLVEQPDYGIIEIFDNSGETAEMELTLAKDAVPSVVIQKLYHDTSLESWFGINMIMLDQGRFPKVFGWREACQAYIDHIRICKRRELEFDVGALNARNHILDGLLIALASIEDVIATIKNSENASAAKANLIKEYGLTEIQAQAILDLKLQRLAHMEAMKIEKELNENRAKLEELNNILATPVLLDDILVQILEDVAKKYGDARRTKIINVLAEEEVEEPEIPVMLRIKDGKIMPTSKKLSGEIISTTNKETLIAFTSSNHMFKAAVKDIPTNGIPVNNLFKTTGILAVNTLSNLKAGTTIYSLTSNGYIKKTNTKDYSWPPRTNVALFKMSDGDTIKGISFNELTTVKVITDFGERIVDFTKVRETTKSALGTRIFGRQENNHIKQIKW